MASIESRIAKLEQQVALAVRLGVYVRLGESDEAAIRRTATENGFGFDEIAAAVVLRPRHLDRPGPP